MVAVPEGETIAVRDGITEGLGKLVLEEVAVTVAV
jgi:hypothetical protein